MLTAIDVATILQFVSDASHSASMCGGGEVVGDIGLCC